MDSAFEQEGYQIFLWSGSWGAEKSDKQDAYDSNCDLSGLIEDVSGLKLSDDALARLRKINLTKLPIVCEI
ncbi:MAG: hypothetical protein HOJ51_15505 [Tateyamaria sp.]|nr:hypothetical protein [Tateyamaria sp.]